MKQLLRKLTSFIISKFSKSLKNFFVASNKIPFQFNYLSLKIFYLKIEEIILLKKLMTKIKNISLDNQNISC